MKNCQKCSASLEESTKFCPSCGAESTNLSENNEKQNPQTQLRQEQQSWQQQFYSPQPVQEKYFTFLYVTSLIFMIFFAIRTISALASSTSQWSTLGNNPEFLKIEGAQSLINAVNFSFAMAYLTFAAVLAFFVLVAIAKRKKSEIVNNITLLKIIVGFSIAVLVMGILYTISEFSMLEPMKKVFLEYLSEEEALQMQSQVTGSLIFDLTFIAFGIINVIKSFSITKKIIQKSKNIDAN